MSRIGRYELHERLGEGAMGYVYKATDTSLDRVVALKVLSTEGSVDELHVRFKREAEAIGRLDHPNIVKVFELGEADSRPYMAMELLEGDDLRHLIEEPAAIPIEDRVRVLIDICAGLAYAHGRGVIHRDIKPANIVVTSSGTVKVLDFGLARVAAQQTITRKGVILGTPDYMCPEQAMGRQVDPRSDIFCAGAVFYEFLALQKPFGGKTLHSVLYQIISERPPAILTLHPEVPARLAEVVHRMLEKDPRHRPQTLEEVGSALRAVYAALRRSGGASALPEPPPPPDPAAAAGVPQQLAQARAALEADRAQDAVRAARAALAVDPEAPGAAEVIWRALRKARRSAAAARPDPDQEARVRDLLERAAPGQPEEQARKAIAELALIAPDDPRVPRLMQDRHEARLPIPSRRRG